MILREIKSREKEDLSSFGADFTGGDKLSPVLISEQSYEQIY